MTNVSFFKGSQFSPDPDPEGVFGVLHQLGLGHGPELRLFSPLDGHFGVTGSSHLKLGVGASSGNKLDLRRGDDRKEGT